MNAYKKICNNLWSSVVIFIRFAVSKVPVIGYKYSWDSKISLLLDKKYFSDVEPALLRPIWR